MRYPDGHKEKVREQIVEEASRMIREHGVEGVSVAGLMKRVGLTHGGFYAHFANKDALVAEAVRAAAHETGDGMLARMPDLDAALVEYLSMDHVRTPQAGCVVAALGTEGARADGASRDAFAYAAKGLIDHVGRLTGATEQTPTDDALEATARMVGAVVLARLVDDPELAARLLEAGKK